MRRLQTTLAFVAATTATKEECPSFDPPRHNSLLAGVAGSYLETIATVRPLDEPYACRPVRCDGEGCGGMARRLDARLRAWARRRGFDEDRVAAEWLTARGHANATLKPGADELVRGREAPLDASLRPCRGRYLRAPDETDQLRIMLRDRSTTCRRVLVSLAPAAVCARADRLVFYARARGDLDSPRGWIFSRRVAATPRPGTWIFRGDESRRRRGWDLDIQ